MFKMRVTMPQVKNSEGVEPTNSDGTIEQPSELEVLFTFVEGRDWSTVTDAEVAIAAQEAKEWLGL
jgi:hypothetical protein